MNHHTLDVREIQPSDIPLIIDYWTKSEDTFLIGMGVDLSKMPTKEQWVQMLQNQLAHPYEEKRAYCTIWMLDGVPVGHCNVTDIIFGQDAYIHLHLWHGVTRKQGMGTQFIKMSIPYFFGNLKLQKIYCEPFAENIASNKTIEKVGFDFLKEYITVPGSISFEQRVKRWELTREKWELLHPHHTVQFSRNAQ